MKKLIVASIFLLTIVKGCKLGDSCEILGMSGVVKVDKKCPYFTSLSGPQMIDHGNCGFVDSFSSATLVCCPTVNQRQGRVRTRLQSEESVRDMCKSFGEKPDGNSGITRIIGGSRSLVGEFPHYAALGYRTFSRDPLTFECGGALVSERFVLTAAHCCKNSRRPVLVRMGKTSIDPKNQEDLGVEADFFIEDVVVHPKYVASQKYHDIAMLKLNETVIFTNLIWPACIEPDFHYSKQQNLIIAGFGVTDTNNRKTSDWLMKAEVIELPFTQCYEIYNETLQGTTAIKGLRRGLTTDLICARYVNQHADTCQGDSGSALQMKVEKEYFIVGVTSFGISCKSTLPSFYTRVSKYKDWIESVCRLEKFVMRALNFIIVFAASLLYKGNCETKSEIGGICQVDGVDYGIVKPTEKCQYIEQIRYLPRLEKKNITLKIRINSNRVCCPSRVSERACAAFGSRPEKLRTITKRIVGGTAAKLAEFPHFASLAYVDNSQLSFDCGGSLISQKFVLTAAHCCPNSRPPIIVRLGKTALFLNDTRDPYEPLDIDVKDFMVHPDYKAKVKYNDIALIEMAHAATFSYNVWPACVFLKIQPSYSELIITGLGVNNETNRERSDWISKGILREVDRDACKVLYQKELNTENKNRFEARIESIKGLPLGITENMICAKNRHDHVDTCQGDSGTALQFTTSRDNVFHVLGITSFGLSCKTRLPSFYTRVSSYIDWIEKIVWSE